MVFLCKLWYAAHVQFQVIFLPQGYQFGNIGRAARLHQFGQFLEVL
jgi:hypothetical protein